MESNQLSVEFVRGPALFLFMPKHDDEMLLSFFFFDTRNAFEFWKYKSQPYIYAFIITVTFIAYFLTIDQYVHFIFGHIGC